MLTALIPILGKVIDGVFPDKEKQARARLKLQQMIEAGETQKLEAQIKTIMAEANGTWLQRSWRPLTMITFVALIVAKWLGFTAPGVSQQIEIELLQIIKAGLGGYVVGRSGEKIVKEWKK